MRRKDNNVPVVSWCCGRVQSSNDIKQKNGKTQKLTNNGFRNPNKTPNVANSITLGHLN